MVYAGFSTLHRNDTKMSLCIMHTRPFRPALANCALLCLTLPLWPAHASGQTSVLQLDTLYNFTGTAGDGSFPLAGVAIGNDGILYGTTNQGGARNQGTVFALVPPGAPGDAWTETPIYLFAGGLRGRQPQAGVTIAGGTLYGASGEGGSATVYQLSPPSATGAPWTETLLYSFLASHDGNSPEGNLVAGPDGTLYGVTYSGSGTGPGHGLGGGVFALIPPTSAGGGCTKKIVYNFVDELDGKFPAAGLVMNKDLTLFGTASAGGSHSCGSVFKLTPPSTSGEVWTESTLYSFRGDDDGLQPETPLTIDSNGTLYGTTSLGGTGDDAGTVFKLTAPTSPGGAWTHEVIYSFPATGGPSAAPNSVVSGETDLFTDRLRTTAAAAHYSN